MTDGLRVSRESIFTGLNNLQVLPVEDVRFCKWFGFTDEEIKATRTTRQELEKLVGSESIDRVISHKLTYCDQSQVF